MLPITRINARELVVVVRPPLSAEQRAILVELMEDAAAARIGNPGRVVKLTIVEAP